MTGTVVCSIQRAPGQVVFLCSQETASVPPFFRIGKPWDDTAEGINPLIILIERAAPNPKRSARSIANSFLRFGSFAARVPDRATGNNGGNGHGHGNDNGGGMLINRPPAGAL